MLLSWSRRTASFTRLLLFSSVCSSSYGSSMPSSFCLPPCTMPPTPVLPALPVWWSHVVADGSPLHDRHGMWYGDGLALRFDRDGFAFSRRFSLISWTSSSMASTSFVCLLGIVLLGSLDDANSARFALTVVCPATQQPSCVSNEMVGSLRRIRGELAVRPVCVLRVRVAETHARPLALSTRK